MAQSNYKKLIKNTKKDNSKDKNSITSILTNFLSAMFILSGIFYFLFTGLFDFIIYSFGQDIGSFLIGLGLIVLILLFIAGSFINIKEGFKKINLRINSKETQETNIKPFYKSLLLGGVPLILSIIFGMIDFYIYEINEIMLLPILTVVFSPFIFAKRLNTSILNIFYGSLFWFIFLLVGFYIFK